MTDSLLDRRNFLRNSTAATAAIGMLGGVWTESAAQPGKSANETIFVGVMGVNGRGGSLARSFAGKPNTQVSYVCDVDANALGRSVKALSELQSKPTAGVGDFRRILDDKSVDALVVAAPDHWHGPATILACAANKHVYCEKPACHNPHEGELMIAAARKHQRAVQLGTQRRSSTGIADAVEKLHNGVIGKVLFARGWINSTRPSIGRGQPAPVPKHLDYTLWQGPAPEREFRDNLIHYNWHWFWHWGTGELGNNGIHALDVCRWGMGVDYPTRVVCGGGKFHFDDDQETPDTQVATFNFGDKAINWEHRTWNRRGFEGESFGATFYGEAGSMVIASKNYTVYDIANKQIEQAPVDGGESEHLMNFLEAIRKGTHEGLNQEIESGVKSTLLCHLGNIAIRTGSTVEFDPIERKIVNNPAAAALWRREYRPGWEPKV